MITFHSNGLLCEPVCIVLLYGVMYGEGAAYKIKRQGCIFYLLIRTGDHLRFFVTITPMLPSMEGTYHRQECIVVFVVHLMLLVLTAFVVCVARCVYIVVLGAHLVLSELAALGHMC